MAIESPKQTVATEAPRQTGASAAGPWLRAASSLHSKVAICLGLLGVLVAVAEQLWEVLERVGFQKSSWVAPVFLLVAMFAGVYFVREVFHARRPVIRRPTTAFIGANSFTERDHERFFGRSNEIEEITRKLVDEKRLRILTLFGESGCGKTSLIRAGLIPELERKHERAALYVRLYDRPARSLREGLRTAYAANAPAAGAARTLFEELRAARARSGKAALVLFIDQFEEFFINPALADEREAFLDCMRQTVISDDASFQLVFAVRSEFLHGMEIFDNYIEEVLGRANRKRIDLFGSQRASEVIHYSLMSATKSPAEGPFWEDRLIARILEDLKSQRRTTVAVEAEVIVLPTELQIVCQMVQRRGWTQARQYTGKERLIRDYLKEAIEASSSPSHSNLVLLAMVHEDGGSRAQPQTPAEIASKNSTLTEAVVRRLLNYFDVEYRLVNQVARQNSAGVTGGIAYELAHEYLVKIINGLTKGVGGAARRAYIALEGHRKRSAHDPKYRLPIQDYWLIRRHSTVQLTPEDLSLLGRSRRAYIYRTAVPIMLAVLSVGAVRYGTVHFDVRPDSHGLSVVVVRRGVPFLKPFLGSNAILVDTGVATNALTEEGETACKNESWRVSFGHGTGARWAGQIKQWRKEKLLKNLQAADPATIARAAEELLRLKLADEQFVSRELLRKLNTRSFEQSREIDLSRIVDLLLSLNIGRDVIEQPLLNMWRNDKQGGQSAALLLKVGVKNGEAIRSFCSYVREKRAPYLSNLDSEDSASQSPLLRYLPGYSVGFNNFGDTLNVDVGTIGNRWDATEHNLATFLNEARDNYSATYDLAILTRDGSEPEEAWVIDLLHERLTTGAAKEIVAAARTLAKLQAKSPWVREILFQRLNAGRQARKTQQSFATNVEQLTLVDDLTSLAVAHSLYISGMSDTVVLDALRARLLEAHDGTAFWLVVDYCLRHEVKEQWLIDALLEKLRGNIGKHGESKEQEIDLLRNEPALAAAALHHLHVKDRGLMDWTLRKLDDMPLTASRAAQDLGEFGEVDNRLVAGALRKQLEKEMEEGDEGYTSVLSAASVSLVKLGEHDQVVLRALHRSIEKAHNIEEIRESAKTLRALGRFDQQTTELLRNRLDTNDVLISRTIAKILAEFSISDETTLEKLRDHLDSSDDRVEAAVYAKLALIDPKRKFEDELEHLRQELLSSAADRSIGYRRAVQEAFNLLAEQKLKNKADGLKAVDMLRAKLSGLCDAAEIHRQLAACAVLDGIDDAVKQGRQGLYPTLDFLK